jgi:hypothetical protein
VTNTLRPKGLFKLLLEQVGSHWSARAKPVYRLLPCSVSAACCLRNWACEAKNEAARRSYGRGKAATRTWWCWADEQLRVGVGALHKLSKRDAVAPDIPVEGPALKSLQLRHLLEADRERWRLIWERLKGVTSYPWRDKGSSWTKELSWANELPVIIGEDIVAVSRTYKKRTGLGTDSFNPRWFGWFSLPLLGVWPQQVTQILVAQIQKPDGGRRPVGLLPTLVGIWERIRKPIIAAWRGSAVQTYKWIDNGR